MASAAMSAVSSDASDHQVALLPPTSCVIPSHRPMCPTRTAWPQQAAAGRDEITPRSNFVIV
eukprot:1527277-Rhodomonas_salina.1